MLMSSFDAVFRYFPLMVITVPPAAGPLAGSTAVGSGSWQMIEEPSAAAQRELTMSVSRRGSHQDLPGR